MVNFTGTQSPSFYRGRNHPTVRVKVIRIVDRTNVEYKMVNESGDFVSPNVTVTASLEAFNKDFEHEVSR